VSPPVTRQTSFWIRDIVASSSEHAGGENEIPTRTEGFKKLRTSPATLRSTDWRLCTRLTEARLTVAHKLKVGRFAPDRCLAALAHSDSS